MKVRAEQMFREKRGEILKRTSPLFFIDKMCTFNSYLSFLRSYFKLLCYNSNDKYGVIKKAS